MTPTMLVAGSSGTQVSPSWSDVPPRCVSRLKNAWDAGLFADALRRVDGVPQVTTSYISTTRSSGSALADGLRVCVLRRRYPAPQAGLGRLEFRYVRVTWSRGGNSFSTENAAFLRGLRCALRDLLGRRATAAVKEETRVTNEAGTDCTKRPGWSTRKRPVTL